MNTVALRQFIREALNEDLGVGDLTTEALVPAGHQSSCVFIAKQPGVIAGLPVAKMVFEELEPQIAWTALVEEGAEVEKGTPVA